jgi:hypothetical protein
MDMDIMVIFVRRIWGEGPVVGEAGQYNSYGNLKVVFRYVIRIWVVPNHASSRQN